MQQKQTEQNLQNYFQCGLCLEEFNEKNKFPRILVCGHTFCQSCISEIIVKCIQFKCPFCRSNLGSLRLGLTYKNYSLLKLMSLNGIQKQEKLAYTIIKNTYTQIVNQMDQIPKTIKKLIIKRTKDDEANPFQFDLIRSNMHSMRFFKLIVTFQRLTHFQLWVKYSAHGFEECLAESLAELKLLKYVRIVNAYDRYQRMREVVALTANEGITFEIDIKQW